MEWKKDEKERDHLVRVGLVTGLVGATGVVFAAMRANPVIALAGFAIGTYGGVLLGLVTGFESGVDFQTTEESA